MPDPDFDQITTKLRHGGISICAAQRAVGELRDHFDDLLESELARGSNGHDARQTAIKRLGSLDEFSAQMLLRRELKTWAFRYPRTALLIYPLACLASLPAMPILAGVANASSVARWGASLLLAGFVTASMLLAMQLSIILG